jgi:hypothetical protein
MPFLSLTTSQERAVSRLRAPTAPATVVNDDGQMYIKIMPSLPYQYRIGLAAAFFKPLPSQVSQLLV